MFLVHINNVPAACRYCKINMQRNMDVSFSSSKVKYMLISNSKVK